jgi:RHS repeat-associated protein
MKSYKQLIAVIVIFLSGTVYGQNNPNEEQALKPYDSWHGGDLDQVSLTDGGLHLDLPLATFPQRGNLDLKFFVRFSNKGWRVKTHCVGRVNPVCSAGWVPISGGGAQIVSSVDWVLQGSFTQEIDTSGAQPVYDWYQAVAAPDGGVHLFSDQSSGSTSGPLYPLRSLDGSGILHPDATTVILPDGTVYKYPNVPSSGNTSTYNGARGGVQPSTITDANGNQISINSSGWTDTMGRVIPGSANPSLYSGVQPGVPTSDLSTCPGGTTSALIWNIPGVAGVNGGVRTYKFCYSMFTLSTNFPTGGTNYPPTSTSLLSAIVLPDTTQVWTFAYDNYGDLTKLGFPTGGSLSYTYAFGPTNCGAGTTQSMWTTSRTVDANDGTGGHTWQYTYSGQGSSVSIGNGQLGFNYSGTAVVTSPDGNDTVHAIANPLTGAGCSVYETQTQVYQGASTSGTVLKTVQIQYSGNATWEGDNYSATNIEPSVVTTIWPTGQTSKVVTSYDSPTTEPNGEQVIMGSLLQKDEYDYSNSLVRSTLNHYLWQDNATYKSNNFLGLRTSSTIKDGVGNQVAQSTNAFDQVAVTSSGITVQLVAPPAGGNIRGNQNTTSHWLDTTNSMVSNTSTYFDTGMKASSTDPLGHVTSYTYGSAFQGAYVTQTNLPDTRMPDAGAPVVHHVVSGNYDFNTGLLTSFTDENNQQYTYTYDIMVRLTQGNHPDGGQTKFNYPDPNTVERQRLIAGSTYDDYKVKFDGIGRHYQAQRLTPDCGSYIKVDTVYDAAGRAVSVSNPYCLTNEPTYGVTQTNYDALSRVTKTIKQDGSSSTVQYNTPAADGAGASVVCTTATDEAGKPRQACADGLGRVVKVLEPGNAYAGTASSGTLAINGTLQSNTTGGHSATPATGSMTINPASGSDRSTQVLTHSATQATGSVNILGSEQTTQQCPNTCNPPMICCLARPWWRFNELLAADAATQCITVYDRGTVSITVGGFTATANYGGSDTPATIAAALASALNASNSPVTASASGSVVNITSKGTGSNQNLALASSSATGDPADFGGPSFSGQTSGSALSGGTDNGYTTVYDSGTVSVTINGHINQASFSQPADTSGSITSRLASAINSDSGAFVTAAASGNTLNFTSKQLGSSQNVAFTSSSTYDTSHFSGPYFTTSTSGSTLAGGTNAVGGTPVYDAGTVSVSVGSFNTSVPYGQTTNSTAPQVATALASAMSASGSPVTATASGSSVAVTYKTPSSSGNIAVTVTASTSQTAYFSGPSFTSSGTTLAGGTDPRPSSLSSPNVTTYQYNVRGDMLCVHQKAADTSADVACTGATAPAVPAAWRQRFFTYDSFSRILTAMNPETNSTGSTAITYGYDADSNLITKKEPAPNQPWQSSATVTMTYSYDGLDRLLDTTYSDGTTPKASARYDYSSFQGQTLAYPIGRAVAGLTLDGSNNVISSNFVSYDPMGRVAATVQCNPGVNGCKTFTASYGPLGQMLSLAYPGNNFSVTYSYDSAARLTGASDSTGVTYAQNPTILASGLMKEFTAPNFNNNKYHVDYNNRLQPTEIWTGAGQGAGALFDKQYSYNAPNTSQMNNGNLYTLTNVVDDTRTQTFGYDALNRLFSAGDKTHWSNTYTYDAWGNLLQKSPGAPAGENLVKTADANNHLSGLTYDAAGNVINDGLGVAFVYDGANRITSTAGLTYIYDAGGRRIQKSTGINYWYGPNGVALAETDSNGNWTNYIFFAGQRLARNVPQPAPNPPDIKYYIADHLHSTAMFVDKAGTKNDILDDNDFYPWGGVVPGVGKTTSNNTIKFSDQYFDAESNLDYFGARYYANTVGRFMSPDFASKPTAVPYAEFVDPQSLNLYSYVRNRPTKWVDPNGHDEEGSDGGDTTSGESGSNQFDGKVHTEVHDDKSSTSTLGTKSTETTTQTDSNGDVTTTTTTTSTLTTVSMDRYGEVTSATSTTTTTSQTVDADGNETNSSSSTKTSTLDTHDSTVEHIQSEAKTFLQLNITDVVPNTFAPKVLDHFKITVQHVLDGLKAFSSGANPTGPNGSSGFPPR